MFNEINFWGIILLVLLYEWSVSCSSSCQYDYDCTGNYRKCCSHECVLRKNCDNSCSQIKDCAPKEKCIDDKCEPSCNSVLDCVELGFYYKRCCNNHCSLRRNCDKTCFRSNDCLIDEYCVGRKCSKNFTHNYCDTDKTCDASYRCKDNLCQKCKCGPDEECDANGECQKSSFTSPAHVAFIFVAIVSTIFIISIVYWKCARMTREQHQPCQGQSPLRTTRQNTSHIALPENTGGPPPYNSLEMNDCIELPPPPTCHEAFSNC